MILNAIYAILRSALFFFNAAVCDDDNSSSIDCVRVKISYDWNVILRRSQHLTVAKINDDAIWFYSRVNKNHEIGFYCTKRWNDIILTQISNENEKKRKKKKKKEENKARTRKKAWNCDNEVFFYIKKKFLTLIEDFYDVSLWCNCCMNKD